MSYNRANIAASFSRYLLPFIIILCIFLLVFIVCLLLDY